MSAVLEYPAKAIRPMRPADIERVMQIETEMYAFPWTAQIFKDCIRVGYDCHVIVEKDQIVGYAIMSSGAGEAHILNVCVDRSHLRKGFAQSLIHNAIQVAKSKSVETLFLEVRPSNYGARQLYQKFGFNEVGTRKDYYPAGGGREDAIILALALV